MIHHMMFGQQERFEDCEQDLRCLATDLLASIKIRINEVSEMQRLMVCMDFDSIVKLVVGERNQNGLVKINEGALESFGTEEFGHFYHHVCSQRHIRELAELKDLMLDPSLSQVVYRALKNVLKDLFWNSRNLCLLMKRILVLSDKDQLLSISSILEKEVLEDLTALKRKVGQLQVLRVEDGVTERFVLPNIYVLEFSKMTLWAVLNEEELLRQIYTNPEIYNVLGVEMCICIDIAMAKGGGAKAIVESFYSSMKAQTKQGGQNTETLTLRTKLEWSIPSMIQANKIVRVMAKIYIEGERCKNYQPHR